MTADRKNPQDMEPQLTSESTLARLVQLGGIQEQPSELAQTRARRATQAAWQRKLEQRRTRQRRLAAGWVAVAATAIAGLWLLLESVVFPPPPGIASLQQVVGRLVVGKEEIDASAQAQTLIAGSKLHTQPGSRVALKMRAGNLIRMDQNAQLVLRSASKIQLQHGRIFVDSPPGAKEITVLTPFGELVELGTQFEVQVENEQLRVRMREGKVSVSTPRQNVVVKAQQGIGDVADIRADGSVFLTTIETTDGHWNWYLSVAPVFQIEDAKLLNFLRWIARQSGRELVFASPGAEIEAENSRLHGSIEGMSMKQALVSVLASTHLAESQGKPYQLKIAFSDTVKKI